MHGDCPGPRLTHDAGEVGILEKAPNVVDHRGAGGQRGFGDSRMPGIHRYGQLDLAAESFDHGHDPMRLFFRVHRLGARAARFSTHIQDVSALLG